MRLLVALVFAVALWIPPSVAEEVIERFGSDIQIEADGTLLVTETISVVAEGRQIRRGIFRDFPTRYRTENGLTRTVGFKVLEVLRDGREEPWFTESMPGGVRVYIGDANVFLQPGRYTYRLTYQTTRQLGFFPDRDELYWNVTGNFWNFPIARAEARIVLPEGATVGQTAVYTGRLGEAGNDATTEVVGARTVRFVTTRTLRPGEGLTVAVGFPKGIVAEVGGALRPLLDNLGLATAGGGLVLVLGYFGAMWRRVGRDPEKGVIIPRFKPPEGLSAAAVSYVFYRGFSSRMRGVPRAFVAALMALAAKSVITIDEDDDVVSMRLNGLLPDEAPPGERAIFTGAFFGRGDSLSFTKANGTTLKAMMTKFSNAILDEYGGRFFRDNRGIFIVGVVMSVIALAGSVALYQPTENEMAGLIATAVGGVFSAFLLSLGIRRLRGSVPGGSVWAGAFFTFVGTLAFLALALTFIVPAPWPYTVLRLVLVVLAFANITFWHLLTAPTAQGRAVMDEIEGFRLYLSVAEADRMNLKDAPDFTTSLFERYLPYAIGLGVEKPWSETLEQHLRVTGQEGTYHPRFYRGGSWDSGSLARSTSALTNTVGSSIASAMPQPKSSGGSGGGGFSGGGGGGGGGGGW